MMNDKLTDEAYARAALTYLAEPTDRWLGPLLRVYGAAATLDAIKSGDQVNVNLTKPVPLHWVYVTAWSASDGIVQFREDIYSRDGLGGPAIPATTKL